MTTHREIRHQRIVWAWGSSLLSKVATVGVQVIAVPLVYRALGQEGYAAYAAVTASAGLIGALNLGIGGSLVTPIADAAAGSNKQREALLVQAGLGPLFAMCIVGACVALPIVFRLPLTALFGRVGLVGTPDLRIAAVIAISATLIAVPLSAIVFLRQAYQEMHLTNFIGSASNTVLCVVLLLAAKVSHAVSVFVAAFVLIPVGAQIVNFGALLLQRPHLLRSQGMKAIKYSRHLVADGLRFIGADFSYVMVYQWPIYWIARTLPSAPSSSFAVCMQAVLLPLASVFGLLQPLWPSTADAVARRDHQWLDRSMKKGRGAVIAVGASAFIIILLFGERLIQMWLRKPITLGWSERACMAAYVPLAIWEYYYFMMGLGFGCLRKAAATVFQRAIAFALATPLLVSIGGVSLVWCGMCCSILFWSAWRLPKLVSNETTARRADPLPLVDA